MTILTVWVHDRFAGNTNSTNASVPNIFIKLSDYFPFIKKFIN
jgi:hypothetical protein